MNTEFDLNLLKESYRISPDEGERFLSFFRDPQRAAHQANILATIPVLQEEYPEIFRAWFEKIPQLPDPDEVLNHLTRILEIISDLHPLFTQLSIQPVRMDLLFAILSQGSFLVEIIFRNPEYLEWLLAAEDLKVIKRWPHYQSEIEALLGPDGIEIKEATRQLRRYQRREILRIAIRDILGSGSIEDCALELSNLADNLIHQSCLQVQADYRRRYGRPLTEEGEEARFAIIALGKLGGRELNFSSDVDLMFVYEGEGHPEHKTPWDNFTYFSKLAADLVGMLSTLTDEGYLYRVDTRLRPEGEKGSLVRSLASMELYYESWGEDWERQALIKARGAGGDRVLGEKFLKTIRPFTFRKYVDQISIQETLRAMGEMRSKTIQVHGSAVREEGLNVKTDPGGIRDVEFFVQAVQILYGGQYPEIRCGGTLESLRRMRQSGLLRKEDFTSLEEGYRFLRRVEHRLQMEKGLQIYNLPTLPEKQDIFARRLGYPNAPSFQKDWKKFTSRIHKIFQGVFSPFEEKDYLELVFDEMQGESLLQSCHLTDTKRARALLQSLVRDPDNPHLNPKIRRLFRSLLPRLLENVKKAPASEVALSSFERIVSAVGAKSSFYTTLAGNPQSLELLVSLGSQSKYLTDTLVRFPSLLERLVDPAFLQESLTRETIESDHRFLLEALEDTKPMEILRRLKRIHILKVGLRYLLRLSDILTLSQELTLLAEYIVEKILHFWVERYRRRYGIPMLKSGKSCCMALIGVGKLGGGELGFSSDLDLLFVYESDEGEVVPSSSKSSPIGIKEYYVRLGTEILKSLGAKTREGALFEADSRLRPYGRGGDLAGTLKQYRDYYEKEGAVWERQALTRARWIAGDVEVGRSFLEQTSVFVYGSGLTSEQKAEIVRLRSRIERERKGDEIKSGYGGLLDVEFLVQGLLLEYGKEYPQIRSNHVLNALDAMEQQGLMDSQDAQLLRSNYLFLRSILNRLQIMDGISVNTLPKDPDVLSQLIRRLYYESKEPVPSSKQFLDRYDQCRNEIRSLYLHYLEI